MSKQWPGVNGISIHGGRNVKIQNSNIGNSAPLSGGASGRRRWDVGVITFLPVEAFAINTVLSSEGRPYRVRKKGVRTYHEARLTLDGRGVDIVATRTIDTGQRSAMAAYEAVRRKYSPRVIILAGIAGGIRPGLDVGDVVVSREIVYYEGRKESPDGIRRRGVTTRVPAGISGAVNNFFDTMGSEPCFFTPHVDAGQRRAIHYGPIGSGEAVIASENSGILEYLSNFNDETLAVETEAGGVAQAFYEEVLDTSKEGWLTVRGISDLANHAKNDENQLTAARNAVQAMIMLIPNLLTNG